MALAWVAALAAYPVGAWFTRLFLTVVTMPLAGVARDARSSLLVRTIRFLGGAASGVGGFGVAGWTFGLFGPHAPVVLPALLLGLVAAAHVPGLRRLAGGPQLAEEAFSFAGEEMGLLAAAAWWLLA
jgi:hypothetical protein